MIEVLSWLIEGKFTFLKMQGEPPFVDPTEAEEASFRKAPESLNLTSHDPYLILELDKIS
jgi:hypothetical protein